MLNGEDIVKFTKFLKLRWFGSVQRMADTRIPKKILKAIATSQRRKLNP